MRGPLAFAIAAAIASAGCAADDDAPAQVTVLVAYTPAVAAAVPDLGALIDGALDDTNRALAASGLEGQLRLAEAYSTDYVEDRDLQTNLERLVARHDDFLDDVHARRDQVGADLVVLLLADDATFAGLSEQTAATADTAFAVVDYRHARADYAFAHELGHLLGAPHDAMTEAAGRTIMTPACDHPAECPLHAVYPQASVSVIARALTREAAFR